MDKADLLYFKEKIDELSLEGIDIRQPGNISYYIDVRSERSSINKITWGDFRYYPPDELVNFHKELLNKLAEEE